MEVHEERKKRIQDRIYYWQQVKQAAIPGGEAERMADKRIRMLENVIIEMDAHMAREAAANEEKR